MGSSAHGYLGERCSGGPLGAQELNCQAQKITLLNEMSSYQFTSRKERNKNKLKNGPLVIQLRVSFPGLGPRQDWPPTGTRAE